MNLVVDTNVVVSAVIRRGLPQRVIDEIVAHDDWFWIVTEDIEREYREVLARPKFKIPLAIQESFIAFIDMATIRVQPVTPPPFQETLKTNCLLLLH